MPWKDWDKIARELSSGEDSDAGDELNVMTVQRNAKRVAELIRLVSPEADAAARFHGGQGVPDVLPALGMNQASALQHMMRDAAKTTAPPPAKKAAAVASSSESAEAGASSSSSSRPDEVEAAGAAAESA